MKRREFLGGVAFAAGAAAAGRTVSIEVLPDWAPAHWAAGELRAALSARGVKVVERNGGVRFLARQCEGPPETAQIGVDFAAGSDARGLTYALLELKDRV